MSVASKILSLVIAVALISPPFFLAATPKVTYAQAGIISCVSAALGAIGVELGITAGGTAAAAAPAAVAAPAAIALSVPVSILADPANIGHQIAQTQAQLMTEQSTLISSGNSTALTFKECVTDPLTWFLKQTIISQLTASMVDWINSGFEGSPMFLSDPQLFFQDMADQIAGEFITQGGLEFMCSPFQLDLQIALITKYFASDRDRTIACRLSDVVSNMEGFLSGAFEEGGWEGWFEMVAQPQNNKFGAFFEADAAISARIGGKAGQISKELDWGKGFLTPTCDADGDPKTPETNCTPGTWVEHQLLEHTDVGLEGLQLADELDEIIGALLQQLVQTVMTGAQGLLGLSDGAQAGGSSYSDQLRNYTANATAPTINAHKKEANDKRAELLARIASLRTAENALPRDTFIIYLDELERRVLSVDMTDSVSAVRKLVEIASDLDDLEENIRAGTPPAPNTAGPGIPPPPTSTP